MLLASRRPCHHVCMLTVAEVNVTHVNLTLGCMYFSSATLSVMLTTWSVTRQKRKTSRCMLFTWHDISSFSFILRLGPRWIQTPAGRQPVQRVWNSRKGEQSVSVLERSGSLGSCCYRRNQAVFTDQSSGRNVSSLLLFCLVHSVKLKHFEKFQDTTEALAGNDSVIVSTLV